MKQKIDKSNVSAKGICIQFRFRQTIDRAILTLLVLLSMLVLPELNAQQSRTITPNEEETIYEIEERYLAIRDKTEEVFDQNREAVEKAISEFEKDPESRVARAKLDQEMIRATDREAQLLIEWKQATTAYRDSLEEAYRKAGDAHGEMKGEIKSLFQEIDKCDAELDELDQQIDALAKYRDRWDYLSEDQQVEITHKVEMLEVHYVRKQLEQQDLHGELEDEMAVSELLDDSGKSFKVLTKRLEREEAVIDTNLGRISNRCRRLAKHVDRQKWLGPLTDIVNRLPLEGEAPRIMDDSYPMLNVPMKRSPSGKIENPFPSLDAARNARKQKNVKPDLSLNFQTP